MHGDGLHVEFVAAIVLDFHSALLLREEIVAVLEVSEEKVEVLVVLLVLLKDVDLLLKLCDLHIG